MLIITLADGYSDACSSLHSVKRFLAQSIGSLACNFASSLLNVPIKFSAKVGCYSFNDATGDCSEPDGAPDLKTCLTGGIVTVFVGPEKLPYAVHKLPLCYYSRYFKNLFCGDFKEASSQTTNLPKVTTDTFDMFFSWLQSQLIEGGTFELQSSERPSVLKLAELYIFRDAYDVPLLRQYAIKTIHKLVMKKEFAPWLLVVETAFANLPESSPLCTLLVDAYVCYYAGRYEPVITTKTQTLARLEKLPAFTAACFVRLGALRRSTMSLPPADVYDEDRDPGTPEEDAFAWGERTWKVATSSENDSAHEYYDTDRWALSLPAPAADNSSGGNSWVPALSGNDGNEQLLSDNEASEEQGEPSDAEAPTPPWTFKFPPPETKRSSHLPCCTCKGRKDGRRH